MSIEVEPNESLFFPNPKEQKIVHDVLIFNSNYHEFASFTIKNPAPNFLSINPASAILYPKTSIRIEMIMLPNDTYHQTGIDTEMIEVMFKTATDPHILSGHNLGTKAVKKVIFLKCQFIYPPQALAQSIDVIRHEGWVHIVPLKFFPHSRDEDLRRVSVSFGCDSSTQLGLDKLYYDPHSHKFVKWSDLKEEIQAFFCPECLFETSAKEAQQNRGLCAYCYECPACCSKLVMIIEEGEYYFRCNFCKWDSIGIGLKDKTMKAVFDMIKDYENTLASEMEHKLLKNREYILRNNSEIEKAKKAPRELNSSMPPLDRYKLDPFDISKLEKNLSEKMNQLSIQPSNNTASLREILAEEDKDVKFFTGQTFHYSSVVSFEQRLNRPEISNLFVKNQLPFRKKLITKRMKRYGDRLMVQRENKKDSIKFAMNTNAVNYIPRISVVHLPILQYNENSFLKLLLVNPQTNTLAIKLTQIELENRELTTALVTTPPEMLILREITGLDVYTDSVYSDEIETKLREQDDEVFVIERRINKLRIRIKVKPIIPAGEVKFVLRVDMEFKEIKKTHNPYFFVFINLGRVSVTTTKSKMRREMTKK